MRLWQREARLVWHGAASGVSAVAFLLAYTVALALTSTADAQQLQHSAASLMYAGVLLAALLGTDVLWRDDLQSGAVLFLLQQHSGESLVLHKTMAHALGTVLPLLLLAVPLGIMLQLPVQSAKWLLLALALGMPALSVLCATLGAGGLRGMVAAAVALPLLVPLLIFGGMAANYTTNPEAAGQALCFLAAFSVAALAVCPFVGARLLRLGII